LRFQMPAASAAAMAATGAPEVVALAAAVACVLYRYSNERRLCVGIAAPLGVPPNALPLLFDVAPEMSLAELLSAAAGAVVEAPQHADLAFSELVERLGLGDITNRNPLFSVAVRDPATQAELCDTRCDVVLTWRARPERTLEADYSTRALRTDTVERFCMHMAQVLAAMSASTARIADVEYLEAQERRNLLAMGKGKEVPLPAQTVLELFARQVAVAADAPALYDCETDGRQWTYRELDEISDRYARALQDRGARRGDRIGLCLKIGPQQLIWMLAILKCGAVVVPIDVTFPRYRIENIVRASDLKDVIAERSLLDLLPSSARTFMVDEFKPDSSRPPCEKPELRGDHPVYLLYTSGSTGRPKGVLMLHRGLANLVCWQNGESDASGRRTFHRTSLTFDVSFQEVFSTWCFGGALVIADEGQRGDISLWPEIFRRRRISRMFLPVVALHQFAEVVSEPLPELKELFVAGEALRITPGVMRLFRVLNAQLINHYGPTESHVVTSYLLPEGSEGWPPLPPIGRPINNARILILDAFGHPAPIGVEGEIWIAGTSLAIGYYAQESLTDERFSRLQLPELRGERAYRTGDFGRFTAEGIIEFAGRRDEQVKLRGYRIELGELETTLASIPGVRQGAAALWTDERGESRLAAYVVCNRENGPSDSDIRQILKERLPDYMVPSVSSLIRVDAIPLTATGKVDRRSLPRIESQQQGAEIDPAASAPSQSPAGIVKAIWARHLRTGYIDPAASFLDLGGHSMLAIQIVAEVNERLGVTVRLAELLRGPTIVHFTAVVERLVENKDAKGEGAPAVIEPDVPAVKLPDGSTVFAPYPPEAQYLYSDIYEYRTYDRQGLRYDENACIIDAGANIGLFTRYALERARGSKVIAIEPVPQLWTQLRRNVAEYGERVVAVNVALGNRNYDGDLTYYPAIPGMSTLHPNAEEEGALLTAILHNLEEIGQPQIRELFAEQHHYIEQRLITEKFPCRVRRLSHVCAELGVTTIDLLKIDVQKSELEVLEGIDDADWPRVRQLVIEVHDIGGRLKTITDFLRARAYGVRVGEQPAIHKNSIIHFVYASLR
jgi:amino acid adenylation domain-containing protein/FkbM family methyltransferase